MELELLVAKKLVDSLVNVSEDVIIDGEIVLVSVTVDKLIDVEIAVTVLVEEPIGVETSLV